MGAKTSYIKTGSPREDGYCERFIGRFRDELLNKQLFYRLRETQIIIQEWRKHYNIKKSHSALGHRPIPIENIITMDQRPIMN